MSDTTDRRHFLKTTLGAGLGAAVAATGAHGRRDHQTPAANRGGRSSSPRRRSIACGWGSSASATRARRT